MEVTKQHLAAVLGGLVGGYMSDDDGLGTAMGIGVGATVGYHWKFVDPPKGEYISYKKKVNTNFDIPLTRVEEDVKRFREQIDKGNYIDYLEPRAKNKATAIDLNNLEETLNPRTLEAMLNDPNTLPEDLIAVKRFMDLGNKPMDVEAFEQTRGIIVKHSKHAVETFSAVPEDIWESVEADRRFSQIEGYLTSLGHHPDDAKDMATMLMESQDRNTYMEIDRNKNIISVGGKDIKISGMAADGKTSVYSDGKSIYAGRRVNPFGEFLGSHMANVKSPNWDQMLKTHGDTFIKSLGLEGTETADVISKNLSRWMTHGMLAEELEALTLASPKLKPFWEELKEKAGIGREFVQEETGLLRSGAINLEDFLKSPSKMVEDISGKVTFKNAFMTKKGSLEFKEEMTQATKGIDTKGESSSLSKAFQAIVNWTGTEDIKTGVGINDVEQYSLRSPDYAWSAFSPRERGGELSRGFTPVFAPVEGASSDLLYLGRALQDTLSQGIGPEALGMMQVQTRLSVPQEAFEDRGTVWALGDGFGYGRQEDLQSFRYDLNTTATISTRDGGVSMFNPKIAEILEGRVLYNVGLDSAPLDVEPLWEAYNGKTSDGVLRKMVFDEFNKVFHGNRGALGKIQKTITKALAQWQVQDGLEDALTELFPKNKAFHDRLREIKERRSNYTVEPDGTRTYPYTDRFTANQLFSQLDEIDTGIRDALLHMRFQLGNNPSEGSAEAISRLQELSQKYVLLDDKETRRELFKIARTYNRAVNGNLRDSEILGIDESGRYVRVPNIAGENVKLQSVTRDGGDYTFKFVGNSDAGAFSTFKHFNPGSKVNIKSVPAGIYHQTLKVGYDALDETFGRKFARADPSLITEVGTSGQKEAMSFVNMFHRSSPTDIMAARAELKGLVEGSPEYDAYVTKMGQDVITAAESKVAFSDDLLRYAVPALEEVKRLRDKVSALPESEFVNLRWGIAQALNAVSEGKATNNAALGLLVGARANALRVLDAHIDPATNTLTDSDFFIRWVMTRGEDFVDKTLATAGEARVNLVHEEARRVIDQLGEQYNRLTKGGIAAAMANGTLLDADMIHNFQGAFMDFGVDTMFSQVRSDETAYGGTGKGMVNMSHFAVSAYKGAGLSEEMLSHFATLSDKDRYDFTAHMLMGEELTGDLEKRTSLNALFKNKFNNEIPKIENFLGVVAKKDPEIVRMYAQQALGVNSGDLKYLNLELEGVNSKTGIKTIPIYLTSTNYGGYTEGQGGARFSSKLNNLHWDIVEAYKNFQDSAKMNIRDTPGGTREVLEEKLVALRQFYTDMYKSSSNAWGKTIFSREAPNSKYMKVVTSGDEGFQDVFDRYWKQGQRVVGFTETDARRMLQDYLGHHVAPEDLGLYMDDERILYARPIREALDKPVEDYLARDHQLPLLNWREPTQHGSEALVHVMEDSPEIRPGEVVVSSKDRGYTKFMIGDMDDDHMFFAAPRAALEEGDIVAYNKWRKERAAYMKEVLPMVEKFGVKGGAKGDQFDPTKAHKELQKNYKEYGLTLEEATKLDTEKARAAFDDILAKYGRSAMEKVSLRKLVTPYVTNMVVDMMNEPSARAAWEAASSSEQMFARVVGGYIIEDVIKSAHLKTGDGVGASVQELLDQYDKYTQALKGRGDANATLQDTHAKWKGTMKAFTDSMLESIMTDPSFTPSQKSLAQKAVDTFLAAANNATPDTANSVMAITSKLRNSTDMPLSQVYSILTSSPLAENLPLEDTSEININRTYASAKMTAKTTILENLKANKFNLMVGAGALGLGSLLFRDDPDFNYSSRQYSDSELDGMTLAGNTLDSPEVSPLGRESTIYGLPAIDPNRLKKRAVEVYGGYNNTVDHLQADMNAAIFGNNPSNVRIEQYGTMY